MAGPGPEVPRNEPPRCPTPRVVTRAYAATVPVSGGDQRTGPPDSSSVLAYRDRQPGRGRPAADPRGPRPQLRADRRTDHDDRALHRGRARSHVRPGGRRRLPDRSRRGPPLPRPRGAGAGARRDRRRRRLGGLGLRRRGPRVRRALRAPGRHVHRSQLRGDAQAGRQDRLQADRRGGRRPGRPVEQGRGRHPGGRPRRGRPGRLPADAEGDRRRWRPRDPDGRRRGRPRGRLPAHPRRGPAGLRQRRGLPRAAGHRRAPRGGAGDRRQPRPRLGARRPGLLGAAAQPEGDRGVRVPAARREPDRRPQGVCGAARARRRVRRSGDRRVPLPPRRAVLRVPGGQHPAPGRAPDHRGDHRHRPGEGADPGRRRRQPGGRQARRGGARRRGPSQRRGPGPRLRARHRAGSRCWSCPRARASGSTPGCARGTRSRQTSTR